MEWILASGSPRRKELLAELIDEFDIIPSLADESADGLSPAELVAELAKRKAVEVAQRRENEGKIVIGSDTVVAFGKQILGKPKDGQDAFRMLSTLSGNAHEVYTGVCFAQKKGATLRLLAKEDCTRVFFHELSQEGIWSYIQSGSPMDKAGAYGIQDGGLVEKIEGSYTNVVGFPKELVGSMLTQVQEEWYD